MKIEIELPRFVVFLVESPIYLVVSALFGVSMSFCLFGLHYLGEQGVPLSNPWAMLNIAIIWFVFFYFVAIAAPVIRQVRKSSPVYSAVRRTP